MKTSSHFSFHEFRMRDDYVGEPLLAPSAGHLAPIDFGSLDAPEVMPAGSTYSYKLTAYGKCIDLQTACSRQYK